ncbi:hypothetical protein CRG98_030647 [Punica granatum]|uniref:Uncharacterized protein n=1 Tax=Punica granatum TaxID=22663 RepID=A0A2I0IY64_PUNGR|nr:hypothetical protein CRG98_030647 [Punica granatum]
MTIALAFRCTPYPLDPGNLPALDPRVIKWQVATPSHVRPSRVPGKVDTPKPRLLRRAHACPDDIKFGCAQPSLGARGEESGTWQWESLDSDSDCRVMSSALAWEAGGPKWGANRMLTLHNASLLKAQCGIVGMNHTTHLDPSSSALRVLNALFISLEA